MQYVVTAMDFTDPQALSRRIACREDHLAGIRKMIKAGTFLSGGAILDAQGKMVGSSVHVEFESREQLNDWIRNDPYTVGKVWDRIDVREVKLVPVDKFKQA